MIFKLVIANALKGQNHQRRATPCDWKTELFQALKGRNQGLSLMSPFQGLNLCMCPFHRALPDANAKRLSALQKTVPFPNTMCTETEQFSKNEKSYISHNEIVKSLARYLYYF